MPFSLPSLPYAYGALEPYIDTLTMEIHHNKHHQKYVDELNKALDKYPALQGKSLDELLTSLASLPKDIQTAVRNNGGGHYNHSFFWKIMTAKAPEKAVGKLAEQINRNFKSFDIFKDQFITTAKTVFGSGWTWLCINNKGELQIISTPNQDSPIMQGLKPVLGLDVWEHAYYLKYQNRRPDYIDAWWNVINWEGAEQNYRELL